MTVQTPSFIIHECERLIEALPYEHKHKAERILEQLNKLNSVENALQLVEHMANLEEVYVYPQMTPRLFKRSLISQSLLKSLKRYHNKEKAQELLDAVQRMARFEISWCQDDEGYKWDRTFNVVVSPTEWKRICSRSEMLPGRGDIQIALEIKKPKKLKTAERAWKDAARKFNMYESAVKRDFDIWFRQTDRANYYIYLP